MTKDQRFMKRLYGPCAFYRLLTDMLINIRDMREAGKARRVSREFSERIMMAVTDVNGCRYCSYFHAKEALKAGLSEEETREYLLGDLNSAPAEELPALLYAQHWAASDARPDPTARQNLFQTYGSDKAEAIETVLHMIRMGNLLGNLGDYFLFKLSFGRVGLTDEEKLGRST